MTVRFSIVVPCYNEAENLPALLSAFERIRAADADWELVLVDNGSTDGSEGVLRKEVAPPHRSFVRVVRVPPPNVGYGHGIMTGLRAARGEWLAWTHADLQTPPSDVPAGLKLLRSSPHPRRTFVKGRRRNRPLRDVLFTAGMQTVAHLILMTELADINAQPKCFHRDLLELATRPPLDLSLDLYFYWLARRRGFAIRTLDVFFGPRLHGESKWASRWRSKLRHVVRTLRYVLALRFEP